MLHIRKNKTSHVEIGIVFEALHAHISSDQKSSQYDTNFIVMIVVFE